MTNDKKAKKLRPDALGNETPENILCTQNQIQNKTQLCLHFKGGVARLILSSSDKI